MTDLAPRLLTKAEAARYCGQTLRNFDRLRKAGVLPEHVTGTIRWDVRTLDAAIDKLTPDGDPVPGGKPAAESAADPLLEWIGTRNGRKDQGREAH